MLTKPAIELVDELHWLGRQLAVLKRVYQSYELIMWRLLQRQRLLREESKSNRPAFTIGTVFVESEFGDLRQPTQQSNLSLISNYDTPVGVQLSSAAVARFERLLDRIKLYCLSEIEACLVEKETLTFLVSSYLAPLMNLVADRLKSELQSNRLERLTSRREANKSNNLAGKSDNPLLASQPDDRVLLNRAQGSQGRIHDQSILGKLWGDHVPVICPAGVFWCCE